jgi:hypothetical protein
VAQEDKTGWTFWMAILHKRYNVGPSLRSHRELRKKTLQASPRKEKTEKAAYYLGHFQ